MIDLNDIQSTILKGHGRKYSLFAFFNFIEPVNGQNNEGTIHLTKKIRAWIKEYIRPKITSVKKQCDDSRQRNFHDKNYDGGLVLNFFLTSKGYDALGIDKKNKPNDASFRLGMRDKQIIDKLRDSDFPNDYPLIDQVKYFGHHCMILLAGNDLAIIKNQLANIEKSILRRKVGCLKNIELGVTKRDSKNRAIDHLGFVDGISNPSFFLENGSLNKKLLPIVLHKEITNRFGSFMVFRRLAQNIEKSEEQIYEVAKLINPDNPASAIQYAKAQLIGRFPNGTPLTVSNVPKNELSNSDNFDYKDDSLGTKCPFHAHIRKANPRNDVDGSSLTRITRRGITYNYDTHKLENKEGVGLLFICFQNSIASQFEKIQEKWLNSSDEPIISDIYTDKDVGADPLAANIVFPFNKPQNQYWNKSWNNKPSDKLEFQMKFLTELKGGGYFYAPSINFLNDFRVPHV